MTYTKTIELDLSGVSGVPMLHTKQNDQNSRFVECRLIADSREYVIPEGITANVAFRKPDGKQVLNPAEILNNRVVFELSQQMLLVPGLAYCEVQLMKGDSVLSSAVCTVKIEKSACDLQELESAPEYKTLLDALQSVAGVKAELIRLIDAFNQAYGEIPDLERAVQAAIRQMQEATDRTNRELSSLIYHAQGSAVTLDNVLEGGRLKDLRLYGETRESLFEPIARAVVAKFPNDASIQSVDGRTCLNAKTEVFRAENKIQLTGGFSANKIYTFSLTGKFLSGTTDARLVFQIKYVDGTTIDAVSFAKTDTAFATKTYSSDISKTIEYARLVMSNGGNVYAIPLDGLQITPSIEKSPDAPTEIHGIENPSVVVGGGNLLDDSHERMLNHKINFSTQGNTITSLKIYILSNKTDNSSIVADSSVNNGNPADGIKLNKKVDVAASGLYYVRFGLNGNKQDDKITFDTPIYLDMEQSEYYFYTQVKSFDLNSANIENLMISTKQGIPYEPYRGFQTYTYPDVTLYSLPNGVRDEINWVDGTLIQRVGKATFNGTEKWSLHDPGVQNIFNTVFTGYSLNGVFGGVCNRFSWRKPVDTTYGNNTVKLNDQGNLQINFYIAPSLASSVEIWKTYLAKNPVTVLYQLAEPITTTLTNRVVTSTGDAFKVKGETTETGTGEKAPDNPYVISGVESRVIKVVNRNLLDDTHARIVNHTVTFATTENTISTIQAYLLPIRTSNNYVARVQIQSSTINEAEFVSTTSASVNGWFYVRIGLNGDKQDDKFNLEKPIYINMDSNKYYFKANAVFTNANSITASNLMITTKQGTVYEPYNPLVGQTITPTLYSLPNGTCDNVDYGAGVYTQRLKRVELTSGLDWKVYTPTENRPSGTYCYYFTCDDTIDGRPTSICDHFINLETAWAIGGIGTYGDHSINKGKYFVTNKPNLEEWKAWLDQEKSKGTPVTLIYTLSTPIPTRFNQPHILTYFPTTNITAPNTIDVAYSKSIASVAQELTDASNKVLSDANTAVANANNAATKANTAAQRAEAAADGLHVEQIEQNAADIQDTQDYIGYTKEDIYGLEVDFTNNKFTRLAGAVGKNGGADFNSVECFGGRKRCIVTDSGEILAYHGETGYTETGALTQAITKGGTTYPIGTMVQVMVYQPKFYYKVVPVKLERIENGIGYHGRKMRYYLTTTPKEGFRLHPAFISDGTERPYILYSAYEGSLYDTSAKAYIKDDAQVADFGADQLSSIAGAKPVSGLTQLLTRRNGARLAENRGKGWHQQYCATVSATQMLFLIEYASFNMQSKIGAGVTGKTDDGKSNMANNTGATAVLGNSTGTASDSVSYRGEENIYGNIWKFVDGMNLNARGLNELYITDHDFQDDKLDGNYQKTGITLPKMNGFISSFGYKENHDWLFLPSETNGTAALPVGDYFYQNNTYNGTIIAIQGGNWDDGSSPGGYCCYLHYPSLARDRAVGTRLVYIPPVTSNTESDIYGVSVDLEKGQFTRLDGAKNLSAGRDFDKVDCFGGRKRCIVTDQGIILAYFGETGYTETGMLTQAIMKDGVTYPVNTAVQVMVMQPKFYYKADPVKLDKIENGIGYHARKMNYYLTCTPKTGFKLHPAFIQNGKELPYILLSAYEGSLYDTSANAYILDDAQIADFGADKLCSRAGVKPISGLTQNLTRRNCGKLAENRGEGWHQQYCATVSATQMLFLIEYASFNMQSKIGAGVTGKPEGTGNEAENTGATSSLKNQTGSALNGCMSYRGEENVYGNIWGFVDGINVNANDKNEVFISDNNFAEEKLDGNYINAGFTLAKTIGYISSFGYNTDFDWLFFPSETNVTGSNCINDYYSQNSAYNGVLVALIGGGWNYGDRAGGFFTAVNSIPAHRYRNAGGRLVYTPHVNTVAIDPQAELIKQLSDRITALEAKANN